MRRPMACHWRRWTPSLKPYDMNGINGGPRDGRISQRKMGKSDHSACQCGPTNCSKKSYASFLKHITRDNLINTHMDLDPNADVILRSGKSIMDGWEPPGLSKEISRNASIMHLDAPLKNASSGNCQNAAVETVPMSSANPETKTGACWDLCRRESCRYGYDHKSNVGQCQGLPQSAKSSALPRTAWGATASAFERFRA